MQENSEGQEPVSPRSRKGHNKISNFTITELFYSHILNMNRSSLHTSFRGIGFTVFRNSWSKYGFKGPKSFQDFRETTVCFHALRYCFAGLLASTDTPECRERWEYFSAMDLRSVFIKCLHTWQDYHVFPPSFSNILSMRTHRFVKLISEKRAEELTNADFPNVALKEIEH